MTRRSLLIRIRSPQDTDAWANFVDLYGPIIFGYCRRRGLQESDASEVAQEVLIQVSTSIATFDYDPDRGRFRGWLASIIKSKLSRFWKSRNLLTKFSDSISIDEVASETDGLWSDLCCRQLMEMSLAKLKSESSPGHWNVFEAVWVRGEPAAKAGRDAEIALPQVYLIKSRCLARLKSIVDELSDDVPWDVDLRYSSTCTLNPVTGSVA